MEVGSRIGEEVLYWVALSVGKEKFVPVGEGDYRMEEDQCWVASE